MGISIEELRKINLGKYEKMGLKLANTGDNFDVFVFRE